MGADCGCAESDRESGCADSSWADSDYADSDWTSLCRANLGHSIFSRAILGHTASVTQHPYQPDRNPRNPQNLIPR
ncbi:hypothetical protein [Pseudoscardovia suis]|uniref:Uncharacterized protein n=1 Tax=Pseudoscardovia suis TaxID=987063 RepID=A0A261EWX9_9BIFI|nr:hypothetical protein [Pseudoscardovia suis]OZG51368.1 hypothetical protein PSSU_0991 [Pseudoscardovia suis]PJJ68749.1 hypothetical protein CLV65_0654 [Pseudoscardovia suis]